MVELGDPHLSSVALVLEMRQLYPLHARILCELLAGQAEEYARYFTPFSFDLPTIERQLKEAKRDIFTGVFAGSGTRHQLVAFWMLRGYDQGYDVPTFGLLVGEGWAYSGIGALCVQAGITNAKLRGAKRLMLKSHPDNEHANRLYESFGFSGTGADGAMTVYHRRL